MLEHDMSVIVLNAHDGLCTYVSKQHKIAMGNILDATKSFLGFNNPERLIHDFRGDKTSCQFTDCEFNLVKHLSDFDDHFMERSKLPMGEVCPFLITTKEELDTFRTSKNQK